VLRYPASLLSYVSVGEPFWGRVPKLSINFDEILSRSQGSSEEQNKVLEPSTIIYCNIINAHYNYNSSLIHSKIIIFLINASSRNAIRERIWKYLGLLLLLPVWKEHCKTFFQSHVFAQSPPDRRPSDKFPVSTSHCSWFV